MVQIVGIVGLIDSGKDTAGQVLIDHFGFRKDSYAASLKDACASIFAWDRDMVEGATEASRLWRERVDTFWEKELNIPNFTPRFALQFLGTEVFRNNFHEDTWLLSAKARLMKTSTPTVFTDCRFPNEINMIKEMGGTLIRIKRGPDPHWFNFARDLDDRLDRYNIHESETSWVSCLDQVDYEILNDSSIDTFKETVYSTFLEKQ